MRIHSDLILSGDLYNAAREARVTIERADLRGSRKRDHAWDILLSGESRRNAMSNSFKAATWDQWGVFLNCFFEVDNDLTVPRVYEDREEFDFATAHRFVDGWPDDAHGDHKFTWSGSWTSVTEQSCNRCTAVFRRSI